VIEIVPPALTCIRVVVQGTGKSTGSELDTAEQSEHMGIERADPAHTRLFPATRATAAESSAAVNRGTENYSICCLGECDREPGA
jgi:hypothetical protein